MNMKTTKTALTSLGVALIVSFGLACTPGVLDDYCEVKCDCEDCSEKEHEECMIKHEGSLERAEIYECDEHYLEYLECMVDKGDCEDDDFGDYDDKCRDEDHDYEDCIEDAQKEKLHPY